jgi:cytochrome c
MNKALWLGLLLPVSNGIAGPQLGQVIDTEQLAAWDISIFPDGSGLPAGSGDAAGGKRLYDEHCAACHGPGGIGLTADALAGAEEPLDSEWAEKTIGSYWPYATTVFDFIRRAKPMTAPGTLSSDEIYALTAYLLYLNGLIEEKQPIDARNLPTVAMPNRDGFIPIDAPDD